MCLSLVLQSTQGKENEDFARNILAMGEDLTQLGDVTRVDVPGVNVVASFLSDDCAVVAIDHVLRHWDTHCAGNGLAYGGVLEYLLCFMPLNADARSINT
ncbi:hypothetical protein PSHT_06549 [Puccinia striiformis]|uniref:Uncharacterized protein n=1 Tax=Puccinia striiformis TaxID=27350 RepID=A0A2S4W562_9BASI|nr:hypothetical protein PSHT_06549 [Puccinia striiformis]